MKVCKTCGLELQDDALFCAGCGQPVETEEQVAETVEQVAETAEQVAETAEQVTETAEQVTETAEQVTEAAEQVTEAAEQTAETAETEAAPEAIAMEMPVEQPKKKKVLPIIIAAAAVVVVALLAVLLFGGNQFVGTYEGNTLIDIDDDTNVDLDDTTLYIYRDGTCRIDIGDMDMDRDGTWREGGEDSDGDPYIITDFDGLDRGHFYLYSDEDYDGLLVINSIGFFFDRA